MVYRPFEESLPMGRDGEHRIAAELRRRGWFVIPSYEYSGKDGNKAPRLYGPLESFTLPDLDVCRGGERIWVEVKTKSAATMHRNSGVWEHGINLRHWRQYEAVAEETGAAVYLCIWEIETHAVLLASMDKMREVVRFGTGRGSSMVYFPRDAFAHCFSIDPGEVNARAG